MKKLFSVVIATMTALSLTACGLTKNLDVVGKESIQSFQAVLKAIPDKIKPDEQNAGWSLSAPDGSARFIWSGDYSKSPLYDLMIEFDAQPFLQAGLNTSKLSEEHITLDGSKLIVGTKLGNDTANRKSTTTALAAYEQIVDQYRSTVGFHTALGHYNLALGNGNLFEWASDMAANDKDIVFVLNPEPFLNAGVDPAKVEGWVFAKVPVEIDGKSAEVDKFLKPFDLIPAP